MPSIELAGSVLVGTVADELLRKLLVALRLLGHLGPARAMDVKNAKSSGVSAFETPLKTQNLCVFAFEIAFKGSSDTEMPFRMPFSTTMARAAPE